MHAQLSRIAFNSLPESIQEPLIPYLSNIPRGAVTPDLYLFDWENHELNIHASEKEQVAAASRITALYKSIINTLDNPDADLSQVAYEMGLLSHYLADINQPLHTDELPQEILLHVNYESDVYFWQDMFTFSDSGTRFRFDPVQMTLDSARQANRFYIPVYSSYFDKDGFNNTRGITWLNVQRAIEDIRDTWLTIWLQANSSQTSLALWSNKKSYQPGESIKIHLSTLQGQNLPVVKSDLYFAVTSPSGELWFLDENSKFVQNITPRNKSWLTTDSQIEVFNALLWPESIAGEYRLHALLVEQNANPEDIAYWISNIASIAITVDSLAEINLSELNNEMYLFPASQPDDNKIITLPLQRWDIIFLGGLIDDPSTPDYNEAEYNAFIPGDYGHILIYLGRNKYGVPYAVEMTHSFEFELVDLRLVRLPEFYSANSGSANMALPVVTKPLWQYKKRWAMRMIPSELEKIVQNETVLLNKIETDLLNNFHYQLLADWSGDFNDKAIYLVDDELLNGANCTDYWLAVFENIGGVCIQDARINASDLTAYYLNDPVASQTPLPDSLNPFGFNITVNELINTFNFELLNPPAHTFSCSTASENIDPETGVAIPGRLINSPQLEQITPVMEIKNWP